MLSCIIGQAITGQNGWEAQQGQAYQEHEESLFQSNFIDENRNQRLDGSFRLPYYSQAFFPWINWNCSKLYKKRLKPRALSFFISHSDRVYNIFTVIFSIKCYLKTLPNMCHFQGILALFNVDLRSCLSPKLFRTDFCLKYSQKH